MIGWLSVDPGEQRPQTSDLLLQKAWKCMRLTRWFGQPARQRADQMDSLRGWAGDVFDSSLLRLTD